MSVTIYDRYNRPVGEQLEFEMPSLTEQHHKDDCDVNQILKRFLKTGILDSRNVKTPLYGDFSGAPSDYRQAVELLNEARARFMNLPAEVRERFGNDPGAVLDFLENPENRAEAEKLGLIAVKREVVPEAAQNENNREAGTTEGGKDA